jgi:hypothetical protein
VQEDTEAAGFQAGDGGVEQERVLEHAAGQGDRTQAMLVAQVQATRLDQGGDAVVEAGGDDRGGDATRSVSY